MKRKYDDTLITTFEIISTDNNFKYIVNNNYTKLWHTNTDLTHVNFPNKDRIEIYLTKITCPFMFPLEIRIFPIKIYIFRFMFPLEINIFSIKQNS
jgi:hypothetical protein